MFKKSMKAVLTVAAIAGMSSAAMADAKVGGSVKAYVGQYNSGATTATSYITGVSEGNVDFNATHGAMSAHMQIEGRNSKLDGGTAGTGDSQVALTYTKDMLGLTIGTIVTGVPYSIVSGTKTSALGGVGLYTSTLAYQEDHGFRASYKVNDDISVQAVLYGSDEAAGKDGSSTQFGFNAKFGEISAMGSFLSSKADDHNGTTGDASSNSVVGVKAGFGEGMSVSVDVISEKVGTADPTSDLALQFKAANMGPGSVAVTYATSDKKSTLAKYNYLIGVYDISVEKGAGIQFLYSSAQTKPNTGSSTTATFIGAGFYSGF
jgi:hypothetical protein